MYDYQPEIEDKALKSVGLELMFMTPEKCNSDKGITAVELAKLVNLPVETVKKKLVILKDAGLVNVKGINPKYWKFDNYNFQRMDEDDGTNLRQLLLYPRQKFLNSLNYHKLSFCAPTNMVLTGSCRLP